MKRPCFALTLLLISLAFSLTAVGPAKCQHDLDPAPTGVWHSESCPYAPSESSGSLGLGHDEDARWKAHQTEEQEYSGYTQPSEAVESTEAAVINSAPAIEAEVPAVVESSPTTETPAVPSEYNYRSDYDNVYDYEVYRSEQTQTPVETTPVESTPVESTPAIIEVSEVLDPYWTESTISAEVIEATEELDPYWTENTIPTDVIEVTEELDPYWTEDKISDEVIDSVETWIEKLNSTDEVKQPESQGTDSEYVPQVEAKVEQPVENSDSTYGAHLWDDCEFEHKARRNCERFVPSASDYNADPAPQVETTEQIEAAPQVETTEQIESTESTEQVEVAPQVESTEAVEAAPQVESYEQIETTESTEQIESNVQIESTYQVEPISPAQQREVLLSVARSLSDVGEVFQTASHTIVRLATEIPQETVPATNGYEHYED